MPESRTITGHTVAMVALAGGGEAAVPRGQSLPDNLADGEMERLEKVGAFAEPRSANLAGQGARLAFDQVAVLTRPAPDLAVRGDGGSVALPPDVTLAANPDPDGPSYVLHDPFAAPLVTSSDDEPPASPLVTSTTKRSAPTRRP